MFEDTFSGSTLVACGQNSYSARNGTQFKFLSDGIRFDANPEVEPSPESYPSSLGIRVEELGGKPERMKGGPSDVLRSQPAPLENPQSPPSKNHQSPRIRPPPPPAHALMLGHKAMVLPGRSAGGGTATATLEKRSGLEF